MTAQAQRFKIDITELAIHKFGLYLRRENWFTGEWRLVGIFETRDEAKACYEEIKDLPEYLP